MAHVPHVYLPGPWSGETIALDSSLRHHLGRVLRRSPSTPVSYTDGRGRLGEGVFEDTVVVRGAEADVPRPHPSVTIAAAPPASQDRQRFVVEKLAEVGVDVLRWLTSRYTQGRPPRPDKAAAWAEAALQQSRGAWLMAIEPAIRLVELLEEDVAWMMADATGDAVASVSADAAATGFGLAVGPEGGWSAEELGTFDHLVCLGPTVLRTETAAIVGAVRCLQLAGRM